MTTSARRGTGLLPDAGGILVVDKPSGPTSHDVVARARRALGDRRIGHTGTLDPLASGVLVLCCGPATRLSQFLVGADKAYRTTIRLGVATDTLDADGQVVRTDEDWASLTPEQIRAAATALVGPAMQVPPAYSAKKVDGERAHRRARRGDDVQLDPVAVTIHTLDVEGIDLPELDLRMEVSSGAFVRSLARDLGEALGTGAHVAELRRTRSGSFDLSDATSLEALEEAPASARWVTPLDAVAHLPLVHLESAEAHRLALGQRLASDLPPGMVRVESGGELVAVAEIEGGALRPRKVFMRPEALEA